LSPHSTLVYARLDLGPVARSADAARDGDAGGDAVIQAAIQIADRHVRLVTPTGEVLKAWPLSEPPTIVPGRLDVRAHYRVRAQVRRGASSAVSS